MNKIIKEGDILEGQIEFTTNGNASLKIEDKDIFIFKKMTSNALHLDTVKIKIFQAEKKLEGKVIEVISRFKKEFVGRVQMNGRTTFVVPDSNKISVDFYIKGGLIAEHGQKVVVEFVKWDDSRSPQGKIINILGNSGDNETEMNSIMFEYGLPIDFPEDVLEESKNVPEIISEAEILNRRDMRLSTTITIDPVDAKDFDDALSIDHLENGDLQIGIHIADVAHYIKTGSKIDDEAYKRSTSVYLVDRCVPMLPERLSNGICSLKPNEDRLAFSVVLTFDRTGGIKDTWIGRTVIHSDRRYSYEEAQSVIEGALDESTSYIDNCILTLNDIAQKLRRRRIKEGSIEMNGIEVKFNLSEDGKKPVGVYFKEQKEANKLIEEFMLLANKIVAHKLKTDLKLCVNRVHNEPDINKLNELKEFVQIFGYQFDINTEDIKESINKLTKDIRGTVEETMISSLLIRCQSKAYYTTENIPHFGLGFKDYSHFTSPIRRYSDVLTHRLLEFLLKIDISSKMDPAKLSGMCEHISKREVVAAKAQRDSIKYKQAEYLMDKTGIIFDGIVSSISDWGMYVELIDTKCEGMIKYQTLEGKWSVSMSTHSIVNEFGDRIRLGDPIKVSVQSVDLEKKQINFIKF